MPLFNLVEKCLQLNSVSKIRGVLNGTSNFILTRMGGGLSFDLALQEAQKMGVAEADLSYDIDGIDTAAKLVILSNAILGIKRKFCDVAREGIRGVKLEEIVDEKKKGLVIKLVGEMNREKIEVGPRFVEVSDPLNVSGMMNSIQIETDLAGKISLSGVGAGPIETASALISDIMSIVDML